MNYFVISFVIDENINMPNADVKMFKLLVNMLQSVCNPDNCLIKYIELKMQLIQKIEGKIIQFSRTFSHYCHTILGTSAANLS